MHSFVLKRGDPIEPPTLVLILLDPESPPIMSAIKGMRAVDWRPAAIGPTEEALLPPQPIFFTELPISLVTLASEPRFLLFNVLLQSPDDGRHFGSSGLLGLIEGQTARLQFVIWGMRSMALPTRHAGVV